MNAKELHDLYAPLWAAVPETMPKLIRETWDSGGCVICGYDAFWGGWFDRDTRRPNPELTEITAALCRVAAEDWLRSRPEVAHVRIYNDEHFGYVTVGVARLADDDSPLAYGHRNDTIHHALVAACLAVHNSSPNSAPSPQLPQPPA